jgi:hypothetical protein
MKKCFVLLLLGTVLAGGVSLGCGSNHHNNPDKSADVQVERGKAPQ